jgi:flagellar motor protein MotB
MQAPTKLLIALSLLGTLGFGIAARSAFANQTRTAAATVPHHSMMMSQTSDGDGEMNPATEPPERVQGEMQHPTQATQTLGDGDGEVAAHQEEQQESTQLQSLTRINADQARQAAEAAQRGNASQVTLDNEDGNLVYKVIVGQTEVTVDAGNGRILQTEQAGVEQPGQGDAVYRSSIQVPNGQDDV